MSKARNNENQKIESLEPMILMSASAAEQSGIDLDAANVIIASDLGEGKVGTDADEIFVGLGGDNCLHGEGGDDLFFTSWGFNEIDGGDGDMDTIRYLGNRADFSVVADNGGFLISNAGSHNGIFNRTDWVRNVEKFEFSDGVVMAEDLLSGNAAPEFQTPNQFYVDENQTAVTTVQATDADGDGVTYSLGTAADGNLFNIDPNTGVLTFKEAPDFENPLDFNGDNTYDVFVKASDGKTTTIHSIWVTVQDVDETGGNQSPFFTNVDDGEMILVDENETLVRDTDASDPDGDTLTYSISDGIGIPGSGNNEDAGSFTIDPNTGVLSFKVAPDFENPGDADGDNEYVLTIVVTDGNGGAQERDVVIKVQDVNEGGGNNAPEFTNIPGDKMVTVDENQTTAFDLAASDADGDTLTYTIEGGADAGLFDIDSATGLLTFKNAPDFENPGDADGDNAYEVNVRVSDGTDFDDDNLIIKVGDVNEGGGNQNPFFTNVEEGEMVTVNEGTSFVGDANGQDPDGDTVTFSIVGGDDAAQFTIDPSTGILSFVTTPDFENPADANGNNEYLVTLQISDGNGGTQNRNIVVKVQDVQEGGGNRAPFFTNVEEGEMVTVPENTTLVGDANGIDPDGDDVTFSIAGGPDAALFTVDPQTGVVSFINAPDFENPGDVGADNQYNITLRISDGSLSQDRNVVVKVTDSDVGGTENGAPFFTNVEEGEVVTVVENNTLVGDANGQDPDGDDVTFSIVGGADASLFTVNAQTGVVSFINAPDFENPGDVGANNEYNITLRISDGKGGLQDRNVVVKVLDANENGGNNAPFFTNVEEGEIVTVPENTTPVGDANAQDPDGDTLTYAITGGADASLFTINAQTGVVSFITAPDFENPGDAGGDNNYQITLQVSDGNGGTQSRNVTVRVTDQSDTGGGNGSPFFTNVEEGEIVTVPENTTPVGDANAQDPDGDNVTFSIVGGADAALFTVNAQTGVVSFITAPDFENPGDAGANNDYNITLRVSDGNGGTQDRNVVVRVTDQGEGGVGNRAPFFTNVSEGETVTVPENTTSVGDANGTDPDGDAVTFSIVGGADASLFNVNAQTGVVSFVNAPDFENPGDADGNNNYQITLRIADGNGGVQDRNVTVQVTDVGNEGGGNLNQSPFFTNVSQGEVVTVVSGNTSVGDADAQDPNGDQITYSISGGADAALFTVNAQTGVVTFNNAPDFANPADADGNNLYQITLRASDGSLFQDRNVTVKVVNNGGGGGGQQNRAPFFINVEQGEFVWFDENRTFVGDANAVDADGDQVTFSVVGGADSALFTINPQTGQLFFLNAPDFENPGDANNDNRYEVTIRVSDGQLFQDRSIVVGVEDVNENGNNGGGNNGGGNNGGGSGSGGGQFNNFFPWLNNQFYFNGYGTNPYGYTTNGYWTNGYTTNGNATNGNGNNGAGTVY